MADARSQVTHRYVPISLLAVGILLIVASWTSVGKLATDAAWTPEDQKLYGRLVQENHRLNYQSTESADLSAEELAEKKQKVKRQLEAMIAKLEHAKARPAVWSRILFWVGAVLALSGTFIHLIRRERVSAG